MTAGQEGTAPDPDSPEEESALDERAVDEAAEVSPVRSKVLLFLGVLLAGAVLFALAFLAMDLPQCENPAIVWIPCIGP